MSKRYLCFYIPVVLALSSCGILAPKGSSKKAFDLGEYTRAADLFKREYSKEKNKYLKGEIAFQMGECYRLTNKPSKAASAYSRALRTSYKNELIELYLGQSMLKMGKPDDARTYFLAYNEKHPTDALGRDGLASCDIQINPPKAKRFEIEKIKAINSKFSDYSPAYGGSEVEVLYFASMRSNGKRKTFSRITGQGPSKVYAMRKDSKGKWLKPEIIEEFGESTFDEGGICVSADGKELYFTRCSFDNTKVFGSEIFVSKRSGGVWGEPLLIPLAGDSLVNAHPAVTADNLTLYFVSDMPGGIGGKDIWKVVRDTPEGEWGKPENLGYPVNSKGDEVFPTVSPDGTLYFSSNGHAGIGGLDIFRLGKNEKDSVAVFNVGVPLNSFYDDFGMVFHPKDKMGMFTSSRDNVKGVDNIYAFSWRDVQLSMRGKIYDEKSKSAIEGAYLRLVSADGTDKRLDLNPDGGFTSQLKPNTDYVFLAAAPGYFNRRQRLTTPAATDDKEFVFDLPLSLKVSPIVLNNIYYSPSGWELNGEAVSQMDRLAQLLNDNPTVRIDIASHTSNDGDETENAVLSQKRAQAILDYLTKKGVATQRLSAKGYAGTRPLTVTKALAAQYRFLKAGDVLLPDFVAGLRAADKNVASKLNHRTEFKVLE